MGYKLNWENIFEAMGVLLVERLKEDCPRHDGELKKSIRGKVLDAHTYGIYMLNYALPVEYGTVPHPVNPEWLRKWCRDKLGDEDARFALANYIKKHGTQPHPFIRPILDLELKQIMITAIKSLGEDAVKKV